MKNLTASPYKVCRTSFFENYASNSASLRYDMRLKWFRSYANGLLEGTLVHSTKNLEKTLATAKFRELQ